MKNHGYGFAVLVTLLACSGKHRPFGDVPMEGLGGTAGVGTSTTTDPGVAEMRPESGPEPTAVTGERLGGAPVNALSAPDDAVQTSGSLACERDAGACTEPDAGPPPPTCNPAPRDCTSALDNDCDGQPDNVLDKVCRCVPDTTELCDQHPDLDGRGQCRAGTRTCVATEGNISSDWSDCEGAQGPRDEDSCVPEDDGDCDGFANEGCDCTDGVTQPCGPPNDLGVCQRGTQTCVDGSFGPCVGATFGTSRDCRANADNDCDGRSDNTQDNVCTCAIGTTEACDTHPGQDGVGQCRAGSRQCVAGQNNSSSFFGVCSGSVDPAQRDGCTSVNDADCDGFTNDGCQCVSSRGNSDCRSNPDASRCNGTTGQCVSCASNADCSLISGGPNVCQAGRCVQNLLGTGATCTQNAQCQSGRCDRWFQDLDGDRHGNGSVSQSTCASDTGGIQPTGFVSNSDDCCDLGGASRTVAAQIFTGQVNLFATPQTVCSGVDDFDYNCSGNIEYKYQEDTEEFGTCANVPPGQCSATRIWVGGRNPGCDLAFAPRIEICFFEIATGSCRVMGSLSPNGTTEANLCN